MGTMEIPCRVNIGNMRVPRLNRRVKVARKKRRRRARWKCVDIDFCVVRGINLGN